MCSIFELNVTGLFNLIVIFFQSFLVFQILISGVIVNAGSAQFNKEAVNGKELRVAAYDVSKTHFGKMS